MSDDVYLVMDKFVKLFKESFNIDKCDAYADICTLYVLIASGLSYSDRAALFFCLKESHDVINGEAFEDEDDLIAFLQERTQQDEEFDDSIGM